MPPGILYFDNKRTFVLASALYFFGFIYIPFVVSF